MVAGRCRVTLAAGERGELERVIARGEADAREPARARVLLQADEAEGGPGWTGAAIAAAVRVSVRTIGRVRQRFVGQGLAAALLPGPSPRLHGREPDGGQEARLPAPDGPPPGFDPEADGGSRDGALREVARGLTRSSPTNAIPIPRHWHEEYQFCLIQSGPGELNYRGSNLPTPPASLFMVHPGEVHSNRPYESIGCSYLTLFVDSELMRSAAVDVRGKQSGLPMPPIRNSSRTHIGFLGPFRISGFPRSR